MPTATGIHGMKSTCVVARLEASLPYSAVIIKNGYAMGYTNHIFVFISNTDGTIEASPIPMEKIGVWMHTDKSQKKASIGTDDIRSRQASFHTNVGGKMKS